ncbi:hypothetical protein [Bilophila sp.]|uniref:hypothetical protein n=1 Tax=Bilophila sp. TaxID=1929485 RepID=UPI003076CB5E
MDEPIVDGQEQVTPTEGVNAPSENGGTPSETSASPQAGTQESAVSNWRASLPEGWADKLKDVESADDAIKALERGLGYKPAEKADDIVLKYPESFKGKVDEGVEAGFRDFCVKQGITPGQAQALLDWQLGADKEIRDKLIEDGTNALRETWGSRFDENRSAALKAFAALDRRMGGDLSGTVSGHGMANDPVFVRAFCEIGKLLSEDTLSGGNGAPSPDAAESAEDTYKNMFKG